MVNLHKDSYIWPLDGAEYVLEGTGRGADICCSSFGLVSISPGRSFDTRPRIQMHADTQPVSENTLLTVKQKTLNTVEG